MPIVAMPDGTQVSFPDDMPEGKIRGMIQLKFPDAAGQAQSPPKPEQNTVEQAAQANRDYASRLIGNIPSSAVEFGKNMMQPFIHPIDTATSIKDVGLGVLENLGLVSGKEHVKHSDAVGNFLMNRYGGIEKIKETMASDPVGMMADLSMILTGGGMLAARAPGVVGKVGEVASAAGRAIDPLNAPINALKVVGKGAAEIAGVTTGVGSKAIETAASAGAQGGEAARAFRENFTGAVPLENVVADAKGAVQQLRAERGAEYRTAMKEVGADKAVLDFAKIDQGVQKVAEVKRYKGQDLAPSTSAIRSTITDMIAEWKVLDPKEFHTAEGLDALKQKIGDIKDAAKYGTPERVIAEQIYNSVRQTIVDQVPQYGKIMKGYEEASKIIKEIEGTLSLNPKARVDTSLRKLQSVLRDNVHTNYGQRAVLANYLVASGAPHLLEALAGQALSKWTPRGLGPLLALMAEGGVGGVLGAAGGLAGAAKALPGLALASPKIVGGAAYGLGAATRLPLRPAAAASFQLGRTALAAE